MSPHDDDDEVNDILRNLRGEHFRRARNMDQDGKPLSLVHNDNDRPSLPLNLIYPTQTPERATRVPGPSPPKSWQSSKVKIKNDTTTTPTWRARALSLFFSPDITPCPVPRLTLLCLLLIRTTCPGPALADIVPFIPLHLRRILVRYTAIHDPLSQIELDALRAGSTHIDTELIVVGPFNTLRTSTFRSRTGDPSMDSGNGSGNDSVANASESWDDADPMDIQDDEPLALRSLVVLSSPLSAATLLAFPPTITHLALIHIPHRIPLARLPTICPLVVFLDLSYNTWLHPPILEEIEWGHLRRLEVLGLRECLVSPKLLLELNRGRWESVRIIP